MKILLTAFDPFGGEKINPALEAVKLVPERVEGAQILKLEVPTVFHKSIDTVLKAMHEHRPDAVICVGQAGGRFDVNPERVAINLDDGRIADNEGNQPIDETIYADGAPAYFSSLPIKAIVKEIREAGYPSSVSNTAGTFVCNHLMYGVLYHIAKSFPGMRGGFIHVPYTPAQAVGKTQSVPSMAIVDIAAALEGAVRATVNNQQDIRQQGGREF